ncbi:MAG: MaoC family dehydratase [Alphaproteobacteria bacterium]|nr:MaoC family dehydratase [Alphaproteobacteria bacterium]
MKGNYFEHFAEGQFYRTGSRTLTEAEITDFARQYDPQIIHTDPKAAAESHYGGIIASGLQTLAVTFLLFFDADIFGQAFEVGVGADALRWNKPVRSGDSLTAEVEVMEAQPSRSMPHCGVVKTRIRTLNQHGETVMSLVSVDLVKRDPAKISAASAAR